MNTAVDRRALLSAIAISPVATPPAADTAYHESFTAEDRMRHHLGMAGLALQEMYPGPGRFQAMVNGSRAKDLSFHLCLYQPTAEHPDVEFITQQAWGKL